jgi:hypothetical protein
VGVAGLQVRPGVDDGNDRLARPLLRRVTHLHRTGAMAEGPEICRAEPARGPQFGGRLASNWHVCPTQGVLLRWPRAIAPPP